MLTKLRLGGVIFIISTFCGGAIHAGTSPSDEGIMSMQQQTGKCTGTVKDASGEPVIGASVVVKGTTNGSITDLDGNFELKNVKKGDKLSISFVGYTPQEITYNGSSINVTLQEDTKTLDEVVVVGYGIQKKANLSGSVASVKMDEVLGNRPLPNTAAALQGAVPGLTISSGSNTPGQTGKSINVRGSATFSNSTSGTSSLSPLILIDNVPGDIDALNPEDIESVTVMKDASSAAIYGARAAAGVILITTKRPNKPEKVSVTYNNNFGFVSAVSTPEQVGLETFLPIYKETLGNTYAGGNNQNIDSWLEYLNVYKTNPSQLSSLGTYYGDTGILVANADNKRYYLKEEDIYDRMMETGFTQTHNFTVSGASDRIRFRMSGNRYTENGPLTGDKDKYTRMTFNGTISADITKWYTQEATFNYSQQKRDFLYDESGFMYSTRLNNFLPDGLDPNGNIIKTPRAIIENSNTRHTTIDTPRFFLKSIFRPVKGLEAVFEYTYQKQSTDYNYYSSKWSASDIQEGVSTMPSGEDYYVARHYYDARNAYNLYATYKLSLNQAHNFSLMAGYSQEDYDYKYYNTRAETQALQEIPSMSGAQGKVTTSDSYSEYAIRSGFFRFNYDYKGRYLLEVNGRYDGSSKFPSDSRFAFFPSFSVAWNLAEEKFMSGTRNIVDQIKPRLSYGSIGNQASAGYYDYIATMTLNTQSTTWLNGNDEGYVTTIGAPGLISSNFTWETITTTNVGLDFSLFNNRLTGLFEWYQRDTKDILSQSVALPAVLGASAPNQNVGKMRTRGWEVQLAWHGDIAKKVKYNIGFNLWDYKSEITSLNFNKDKSLSYLYEGKKVGEIWGYEYDGFYTKDDFSDLSTWTLKDGVATLQGYSPRPGDYKFKNQRDGDYNDDDVNSINSGKNTVDKPGDQVVIGNTTPRFQYGINLGVNYAGFDLSLMLQGVGKRDYFNSNQLFYTFMSGDVAFSPIFKGTTDYWTPLSTDPSDANYMVAANPDAKLPRIWGSTTSAVANASSNRRTNDHMLSSASYMRIKNLTLSYTFPQQWMNKIQVKQLRVFVSAENLATFTSLPSGIDPETLSWDYPLYRTVSFGASISF